MAYPKVGSFGSSHYKIEDCPTGHAERHLVRDEGVAGSNPATPTSFLILPAARGERYGERNGRPAKAFCPD